jgi:hypothetical protein
MSRRAVSTAGEFKPQEVANLMWAYASLGLEPGAEISVDLSAYLSLSRSSHSIASMSQLHQCFLCMDLEGLLLRALPPLAQHSGLPRRCRAAFEGAAVTTSGLERAVEEGLARERALAQRLQAGRLPEVEAAVDGAAVAREEAEVGECPHRSNCQFHSEVIRLTFSPFCFAEDQHRFDEIFQTITHGLNC